MPSKKSIRKVVRKAKVRATQTGHKVGNIVRAKISGTEKVKNAKKLVRDKGKTIIPGENIPGSRGVAHGGPLRQKAPRLKKIKHKVTHKTPKTDKRLNTKAPSTSSTKK